MGLMFSRRRTANERAKRVGVETVVIADAVVAQSQGEAEKPEMAQPEAMLDVVQEEVIQPAQNKKPSKQTKKGK